MAEIENLEYCSFKFSYSNGLNDLTEKNACIVKAVSGVHNGYCYWVYPSLDLSKCKSLNDLPAVAKKVLKEYNEQKSSRTFIYYEDLHFDVKRKAYIEKALKNVDKIIKEKKVEEIERKSVKELGATLSELAELCDDLEKYNIQIGDAKFMFFLGDNDLILNSMTARICKVDNNLYCIYPQLFSYKGKEEKKLRVTIKNFVDFTAKKRNQAVSYSGLGEGQKKLLRQTFTNIGKMKFKNMNSFSEILRKIPNGFNKSFVDILKGVTDEQMDEMIPCGKGRPIVFDQSELRPD